MINIKNYYAQLSELRIAEQRLITLKNKKKLLEAKVTSTTSTIKEVVSFGSTDDKMTNYIIKCEEIDNQIKEVEEEIEVLKKGLHQMDEILSNISGIEERIFRLYYIENKNPTQISFIIPCDRRTVYRYLKKIKEKM